MAKPVLGKSVGSDWFYLGRDFAVRTVSMETVEAVYFCFGAKPANSKFATRTAKKMWILSFFTAKLPQKAKKDWNFTEISKADEEDEHSPSAFYYPQDLETFDAETETGITVSQEAIDDFISQQKSANTNK